MKASDRVMNSENKEERKEEMEVEKTEREEELEEGGFKPGNIHLEKFRKFWKEDLKSSDWILNTLKDGYKIPITEVPGPYEEKNNATVLQNMKKVRGLVGEIITMGVVKVVKEKPHCVSPLGLVSSVVDRKMKDRLIFDASRWLNLKMQDQHVKLAHLEKALELTEKDDYQATFDLKSAFYHIKIHEDHKKYLGAAIQNSDEQLILFTRIYRLDSNVPSTLSRR